MKASNSSIRSSSKLSRKSSNVARATKFRESNSSTPKRRVHRPLKSQSIMYKGYTYRNVLATDKQASSLSPSNNARNGKCRELRANPYPCHHASHVASSKEPLVPRTAAWTAVRLVLARSRGSVGNVETVHKGPLRAESSPTSRKFQSLLRSS